MGARTRGNGAGQAVTRVAAGAVGGEPGRAAGRRTGPARRAAWPGRRVRGRARPGEPGAGGEGAGQALEWPSGERRERGRAQVNRSRGPVGALQRAGRREKKGGRREKEREGEGKEKENGKKEIKREEEKEKGRKNGEREGRESR